jgi:hypothetical protein
MCTKFWFENLMEKDELQDLGADGGIILKCILKKEGVWSGFIWLRIWSSGRLL